MKQYKDELANFHKREVPCEPSFNVNDSIELDVLFECFLFSLCSCCLLVSRLREYPTQLYHYWENYSGPNETANSPSVGATSGHVRNEIGAEPYWCRILIDWKKFHCTDRRLYCLGFVTHGCLSHPIRIQ